MLLVNANLGAVTQGWLVRTHDFIDGSFIYGGPSDVYPNLAGYIGVVKDLVIAPAAVGKIVVCGPALVAVWGGLTLAVGDTLWMDPVTSVFATNDPPDGTLLVPVGVVTNRLGYAGAFGHLVQVALFSQHEAGDALATRTMSRRLQTFDALYQTIFTVPLKLDTGYQFDVDVVAMAAQGGGNFFDNGEWKRVVGAKNIGGVPSIDIVTLVSTWKDNVNFDVRFILSGANLLCQVRGDGFPLAGVAWAATARITAIKAPAFFF
jgi:hypothetical protein